MIDWSYAWVVLVRGIPRIFNFLAPHLRVIKVRKYSVAAYNLSYKITYKMCAINVGEMVKSSSGLMRRWISVVVLQSPWDFPLMHGGLIRGQKKTAKALVFVKKTTNHFV